MSANRFCGHKVELASWVVLAGRPEQPGEPVNAPITPVSNYRFGGGKTYSRGDVSPTAEAFETVVGGLEGGGATAFASGMAAASAVFDAVPLGATIAIPSDCYHGVSEMAAVGQAQGRWKLRHIDLFDTTEWLQACRSCALVWLESPSNPLLEVSDVRRICAEPRSADTIVAVDNTFATPINQRPLELGADVVVHSATKLLGGHADLLAGVVVASSEALIARHKAVRERNGATPGVLEMYLATRGVRTLALRLERAQENAVELATRLAADPRVEHVHFPGLPSDPGHELAKSQWSGFGTVVSFVLPGGGEAADAVCQSVEIITHATSLGGVESTLERRAAQHGQEHIPAGLLRMSVGIEDPDDLWRDLDAALDAVGEA